MGKYQIIGCEIEVSAGVATEKEILVAIERIRYTFNEMAMHNGGISHADKPGGAIRWVWIWTLLKLEYKRLQDEGVEFASDDKTRYTVNLLICDRRLPLRATADREHLFRTAAELINKRYCEVEKHISNERLIWRYMALESALQRYIDRFTNS